MQREDYMNMLAILERSETLSRGAIEATATAVLYQNIKAHIQEIDAEAAEKGRLDILAEAERQSELQDDHGEIDESDVKE